MLFSGTAGGPDNGNFYAIDARSGQELWRMPLAGSVYGGGPITFSAGGTQYVAVTAGRNLFSFAVRK